MATRISSSRVTSSPLTRSRNAVCCWPISIISSMTWRSDTTDLDAPGAAFGGVDVLDDFDGLDTLEALTVGCGLDDGGALAWGVLSAAAAGRAASLRSWRRVMTAPRMTASTAAAA